MFTFTPPTAAIPDTEIPLTVPLTLPPVFAVISALPVRSRTAVSTRAVLLPLKVRSARAPLTPAISPAAPARASALTDPVEE